MDRFRPARSRLTAILLFVSRVLRLVNLLPALQACRKLPLSLQGRYLIVVLGTFRILATVLTKALLFLVAQTWRGIFLVVVRRVVVWVSLCVRLVHLAMRTAILLEVRFVCWVVVLTRGTSRVA